MTSEYTDMLILAFTSKTGQSVAGNIHRFFYFIFSLSERIYCLKLRTITVFETFWLLTKFEAPIYNSFRDILIANFQSKSATGNN